MENNTHTQLPENLIVVDREWLDIVLESVNIIVSNYEDNKLLKDSEYYRYKGMQSLFKSFLSNSYSLTPILEEALRNGVKLGKENNFWDIEEEKYFSDDDNIDYDKQSFLSKPITLKNENKFK